MRHWVAAAAALSVSASGAGSQGPAQQAFFTAPQTLVFTLQAPVDQQLAQTVVPVLASIPIGARLRFDVATAWASTTVSQSGVAASWINGLTDTEVQASYTLGEDAAMFALGLNLPTGTSQVTQLELAAAGAMGNDFLALPITHMGSGMAITGAASIARTVKAWRASVGGSFRRSSGYEPFDASATPTVFRFQPADEYRLRLAAEGNTLGGAIAASLSYMVFGEDIAGPALYSTGSRSWADAVFTRPIRGIPMTFSGAHRVRGEGTRLGGAEPAETFSSIAVSGAFTAGSTQIEPTIGMRWWSRETRNAGQLTTLAARAVIPFGPVSFVPGLALHTGLYNAEAETITGGGNTVALPEVVAGLRGWHLTLALRASR